MENGMSFPSGADRNKRVGLSVVDRRQGEKAHERSQPSEEDTQKANPKEEPEENLRNEYYALEKMAETIGKKMFAEMQAVCAPEDVRGIKELLSGEGSEGMDGISEAARFFRSQMREAHFTGESHDSDLLRKVVLAHLEATARTCRDLPIRGGESMDPEERKKRNGRLRLISEERVSRPSSRLAGLAIGAEQRKLLGMKN